MIDNNIQNIGNGKIIWQAMLSKEKKKLNKLHNIL